MNSDKKKLIAEYALSNEDNLMLTAQIAKTFDYILEKLVIDVMEDLEILIFMYGETVRL